MDNMSQCVLAAKANSILGCIRRRIASREAVAREIIKVSKDL